MGKLIFLGDSITDARRLWLKEYQGLGNGYVWLLKKKLEEQGDHREILNKGHDGFTLPFLLRTLERDCLRHHPEAVSLLIGINDVAVSMNTGKDLEEQEFGANYDLILKRLLEHGIKDLFLLGPFLFPKPLEFLNWMEEVKNAEAVMAQTARRYSLPFLPLLDKMNKAAETYGIDQLTADGVHLTNFGQELLATWWMETFYR